VLKFGGVKALTKHLPDELRCHLIEDDVKVEVEPEVIDNSLVIDSPQITPKPKNKMKVKMVKAKMTTKKSNLEKATNHLYDLEDCNGPEKTLKIDFGLYQMEDH
jgi:hypothetical protein